MKKRFKHTSKPLNARKMTDCTLFRKILYNTRQLKSTRIKLSCKLVSQHELHDRKSIGKMPSVDKFLKVTIHRRQRWQQAFTRNPINHFTPSSLQGATILQLTLCWRQTTHVRMDTRGVGPFFGKCENSNGGKM